MENTYSVGPFLVITQEPKARRGTWVTIVMNGDELWDSLTTTDVRKSIENHYYMCRMANAFSGMMERMNEERIVIVA